MGYKFDVMDARFNSRLDALDSKFEGKFDALASSIGFLAEFRAAR